MEHKKRGRGRPEIAGKWLPHDVGSIVEGGHRVVALKVSFTDGVAVNLYECALCGGEFKATKGLVRRGKKSCGCRLWRMGKSEVRLKAVWRNMLSRCTTGRYASEHYADRGITVCDEWRSFPAFRDWALSSGYSDDLTIDRIDVDDGYKPSNCRFVTKAEQTRNRRDTVMTWEKVHAARSLYRSGASIQKVCEEIGVDVRHRATVASAIRGKTWSGDE